MSKLQSINPSNYQVLGEVEISSAQAVEEAVRLARRAQLEWKCLSLAERVKALRNAFEEFKIRKEEFALLQTREMGMVGLNGTNYIQPWNPFGGYKNSGFGRQHGKSGFHEVTKVKLVVRDK